MSGVPDWASSGLPLFLFLFVVVFCRAQGTYWLGRAATHGILTARERKGFLGALARWFNGPTPRKGATLLERWGLLIIPLSFLTVGVQTAVNAGAGIVRLRWRTYTLAMIPGCLMWAALYSAGLLALWVSVWTAVAGSPWGWAGLALLAMAATVMLWHRRKRRSASGTCPVAPLPSDSIRPETA